MSGELFSETILCESSVRYSICRSCNRRRSSSSHCCASGSTSKCSFSKRLGGSSCDPCRITNEPREIHKVGRAHAGRQPYRLSASQTKQQPRLCDQQSREGPKR